MKNLEKKESVELARTFPELNPFGTMRRFAKEMDRLFEDYEGLRFPNLFNKEFMPFRPEFENLAWMPPIELRRNDGELMVKADLPGLTKDDVKVELTNEMLTISGERKEEKEEKHEGFYRSERSYGHFFRQIPLPEGVKTDKAVATFRNGVLEISIPAPKMESHTRRLEIKEATEKSMKASA